ncbi:hypothetical protein SDC9_66748 [bioreactor metagenome]|uniref:Uncharacterized protein n=1 Tax=bioreactor metagenome TaxID=1076179 RepID=A0A644XW51_9ZZZZ
MFRPKAIINIVGGFVMNVDNCRFNEQNSAIELYDNDNQILLTFELKRLKSTAGYERLSVIVKESKGDRLGQDTINPTSIMEGLLGLKQYGVVLSRKVYADISKRIEENYLTIPSITKDLPSELTDAKLEEIFSMFCEYIKDSGAEPATIKGSSVYNIPVPEFTDYLKDSDYRDIDSTKIRNGLRDKKYTHCNPGRNDNTVVDADAKKAVKVISFKADMVDKVNGKSKKK